MTIVNLFSILFFNKIQIRRKVGSFFNDSPKPLCVQLPRRLGLSMAPASGSEVVVAEQVIVIVGACMSMVASLTLVTVIIALTWRGSRKCNISRGENSTRFLTLMVLGFSDLVHATGMVKSSMWFVIELKNS